MTPTPTPRPSDAALPTPEQVEATCKQSLHVDGATAFLEEAARYFENRPTNGEDRAHWSNTFNAETCRSISAALRGATEQVRVLTGERDRQYEENVERIAKEQVERARAEKAEAALEKTREAFEEVWSFYEGEHYYDHPCSVRVRTLIEQADALNALAAKPEADHG